MNTTLGFKIKNRRESLNLTQEYVADKLGISQPAYANLENGITKVHIDKLAKISEILEIDIADILDNKYVINTFNNNASRIQL
jgi:transcriptional regulator with XRE-family HTH domain